MRNRDPSLRVWTTMSTKGRYGVVMQKKGKSVHCSHVTLCQVSCARLANVTTGVNETSLTNSRHLFLWLVSSCRGAASIIFTPVSGTRTGWKHGYHCAHDNGAQLARENMGTLTTKCVLRDERQAGPGRGVRARRNGEFSWDQLVYSW